MTPNKGLIAIVKEITTTAKGLEASNKSSKQKRTHMNNTILFGNGINRLTPENISWGQLLDLIKDGRRFNDANLPNTMIYERVLLERPDIHEDVSYDEFEVKNRISELLKSLEKNKVYKEFFKLNVQNYLTTNYDYAFIDSVLDLDGINLPIHEYSTEDVYSIRRLKRISNQEEKIKLFWQLHGEIRKPATIMLGLDHYCGSIGKIDSYIKGWYRYTKDGITKDEPSIEKKFENNSFNNSSWVELFFTSDIHIVGFSFDFSEIDLWWILNKRARLKKSKSLRGKINNKIFYYCDSIDEHKKGLFESFDIEVIIDNLSNNDDKYTEYYSNLINRFKRIL